MSDTSNGMDLLLTKLLPMVIQRLKALEDRVAALETPKPKRTRKKKEDTPVQNQVAQATTENCKRIADLYESATGIRLESVVIGSSSDGTSMTVNDEIVTPDAMRSVEAMVTDNPAATVTDVAVALNMSVLVVCYIVVILKLYDFTA